METQIEVIALNMIAIGLTAGILLVVAGTPAYPIAIGIELVVILYYLLDQTTSSGLATSLQSFLSNPSKVVSK